MANWHSCLLSIFTLLFILFIYYFFFNDLLYHRYILYWFVIIFKYYYRFLFFLIFNHLYLFIFMLLNYFFDFVMYTWYYVLLFHSLGVYVNLMRSLTKNLSIRFENLENSNLFTSPCWILRIYSKKIVAKSKWSEKSFCLNVYNLVKLCVFQLTKH